MSDAAFDVEHSQRLQQLLDTPVVKFLQDFRDPVLHSHLPQVVLTISDRAGQLRRQLTVSVAELVPMYKWSVGARRYIKDAQEGYYADQKYMDLTAAADGYQAAICEFYDWFYSSVATVKREQIREFATRREELGRLQAALQKSPPTDGG